MKDGGSSRTITWKFEGSIELFPGPPTAGLVVIGVFNFEWKSQRGSCLCPRSGTKVAFDHSDTMHACFFPCQKHPFYFRWIPSELNSGDLGSRRYDPFCDPSKALVDRIGSNSGFAKQVYGQPQKPAPLVATESSGSGRDSGASHFWCAGAESKGEPEEPCDEVVPAQPGEVPRNHQGYSAPPGDRTVRRRRHRKRRGGARQQRKRQRSALLSDRQTTSASEAETGAAPRPDEMGEQGHLPGSNSYLELRSVSGPTGDKYRTATKTFL